MTAEGGTSTPTPGAAPASGLDAGLDDLDHRQLVRSSAVVASGTLLSRVASALQLGLLAYALGRATLADTYNLANSMPNIVFELVLGGVLSATLVPLFVEYRNDDRAINALFTVALSTLVVLTAVAVLLAPWITNLYTLRGVDRGPQREVMTTFVRLFLPQMVFYGLTALGTAYLNSRRRYTAAAYAPLADAVIVIATLVWFVQATSGPRSSWTEVRAIQGHTHLILLLGLGTTAGIVAMALVLVPALRRAGLRYRPVFDWRHPAVVRMLRLSGWTIGYVVVNQIALSVVLVLANGISGGVAAYQYAFIFFQFPHGLFAVSIMTTVTPELARHASARDTGAFRAQYATGLRMLVLVVLPAAVAFAIVARPLVGLLRVGAFATRDVVATAQTLQGLALGLVFFSVYLYTLRGFYALQDTRTPFFVNTVENAINIALAFALFHVLEVRGLAIAYSGAYVCAAVLAVAVLQRRLGTLVGRETLVVLAKIVVASAALAAVMLPLGLLAEPSRPLRSLAVVGAAGIPGLAAYILCLRALRVEELATVVAAFRRRAAA
jgi:putative peptidoglycan lipid II flippase